MRKYFIRFLPALGATVLLVFLLFSDQFRGSFAGGPGVVARALASVFTEWTTQWMIFACLGIYFAALAFLRCHRAAKWSGESRGPAGIFFLAGTLGIGAGQYAFGGVASVSALILVGGAVLGQAVAAGMDGPAASRRLWIGGTLVGLLIGLLTVAAVWHPAAAQSYSYRLHDRWSGPWNNPNAFGLLMGTGVILATGMAAGNWRLAAAGNRGTWRPVLVLLCLTAILILGYGVLHSYSRGAWVATGLGGCYLIRQWLRLPAVKQKNKKSPPAPHRLSRAVDGLRKHRLPLAVLFLAMAILCFWHFQQTGWHLARRAFSVVNPADFSWRNRIAAWQGAGQITAEHPWWGAGWDQPKPLYEHYYLPPKLDESAAIEMNDLLLLGATLGFPALLCFGLYLWRTLTGYGECKISPCGETAALISPPEISPAWYLLTSTCRAGAIGLLLGFWFDGGLFRLPTAALFWILLGLGGSHPRPVRTGTRKRFAPWLQPEQIWMPLLGGLLLLGALFWARAQDPFSRRWFTLETAGLPAFKCVAVLPRPVSRGPVIVYAHDAGDNLMGDGADLRQLAELGLATISLEYNQTNAAAFSAQFEAVLRHVGHQPWADPHATAWIGFGLGAERMREFCRQHPELQPQLLVLLGGQNFSEPALAAVKTTGSVRGIENPPNLANDNAPPVLLVQGERDTTGSTASAKQMVAAWQSTGAVAGLKIIPSVPHDLEPERSVGFRSIGEYCRACLLGKAAWNDYRSLAQWQAAAPPLWRFWLPPGALVAGFLAWRRVRIFRSGTPPPDKPPIWNSWWQPKSGVNSAGETQRASPGQRTIMLRWLALIMGLWALAETGVHLITPRCPVTPATLAIARHVLVAPEAGADFEALAPSPIWQGQPLQTLLNHVTLSNYDRQLVKWPLDDTLYRDYVLSPVLAPATAVPHATADLDWRRPLWEEFYPRIRRATTPAAAAAIVIRHLRERITIASLPGLPHDVSGIWLHQITDPAGFDIITVATLRSVGVPARLNSNRQAEFYDGRQWQTAPAPAIVSWLP